MKIKKFLINMVCGAAIGVSIIIPGVSGGTIAVLLNVYEQIIDSISSIRRNFKKSFTFLLPIILGAIVAIIAAYFPLKFALDRAPLPTVLLFTGLMAGSLPKLLKDGIKQGFGKINVVSVIVPLAAVIGICFIPGMSDVDLSASMPIYGYVLLIVMGAAASCALVIPGISGSMLLLIFGYYNPILSTVSALRLDFWHSLLVLVLFALGILVGFFTIAKIMKVLLSKYPRGTYWAIIGFVIGSIAAIFITFKGNFPEAPYDAVQIAVGVILCISGAIGTFALTSFFEGKQKKQASESVKESD